MDDQYGMADLRQYIGTRPDFIPPPDLLPGHRGLGQPHPYDMLVFRSDSTNSTAPTVPTAVNSTAGPGSSSAAAAAGFGGFGDGGAGRWPRQETLTLLEIRSRLDPKFKEANQKSPLWDEVSRIMSEEHGYQRSGKKCREKFENLYKYYKKTKEGKAGRQDGKHYRFFRQLEALCGETNNKNYNSSSASISEAHHLHHHHQIGGTTSVPYNFPNKEPLQGTPKFSDNTSLSLSNYSDEAGMTSSDDDTEGTNENKPMSRKTGWKVRIKDFMDLQMKKMIDKQEAWMERTMAAIERKEHERMMREEEWRRQDAARIEREHRFWASERAWIEARDAALMEALHKVTGKELMAAADARENQNGDGETWPENEISRLVELKTGMEGKYDEGEEEQGGKNVFWGEIGNKMSCFGHDRSGVMCKDKWESVNNYLIKCSKKRKEDTKSCSYFNSNNHASNQGGGGGGGGVYCHNSEQGVETIIMRLNDQNNSSTNNNNNNNNNNNISDSCFRYFMGDGYGRIMD